MTENLQSKIGEYAKNRDKAEQLEMTKDFDSFPLIYLAEIFPSSVNKKEKENEQSINLCNYTDVYYNQEITNDLEFMSATATESEIKKFSLREGDILLTKDSESWDDIGIPAYVGEDLSGVLCGYHLFFVRPNQEKIHSKYLYWALSSQPLVYQFEKYANGVTRYGLATYNLSNITVPTPPIDVQKKIIAYIQHHVSQIDSLIQEKQKLIELLNEKIESKIAQAVTQGLSPESQMRDVELEWINKLPDNWEVKKLGWLLVDSPKNGISPSIISESEGVPTFSISAVRNGVVSVSDHLKFADIDDEKARKYVISEGDVLMVRGNGNINMVGKCGVVIPPIPEGCIYPDILIRLNFQENISEKYFVYAINSAPIRPQIEVGARTSTGVWKVSQTTVSDIKLPFPPISEQKKIVSHLDSVTEIYNGIIEDAKNSIDLLNEKRESIITKAVLGQIAQSKMDRVAEEKF